LDYRVSQQFVAQKADLFSRQAAAQEIEIADLHC
jgi:hypothetical protein